MPAKRADRDIDRLYQLPLDQFTAARNALAKETGDREIRSLARPPVAAWAVNQVYWQQRKVYDALIEAARGLRAAHKAVLGGRKADLRGTGRAHDEAVDAALQAAVSLLSGSGHPVTDATRQGILNTLRALPSDDPPGRLTRTLQPGGFEMLAGFSIATGRAARTPAAERVRQKEEPPARAPAAEERAKEAAAEAQRELREAEQAARREEFEAARAAREAERAARRLETARERLAAVQQDVEEAQAALDEAERAREAAERKSQDAARRVEAARKRV